MLAEREQISQFLRGRPTTTTTNWACNCYLSGRQFAPADQKPARVNELLSSPALVIAPYCTWNESNFQQILPPRVFYTLLLHSIGWSFTVSLRADMTELFAGSFIVLVASSSMVQRCDRPATDISALV